MATINYDALARIQLIAFWLVEYSIARAAFAASRRSFLEFDRTNDGKASLATAETSSSTSTLINPINPPRGNWSMVITV